MRTLPTAISLEREKKSAKPFYVLEIEFGGSVGTKQFSGRDLTGIITPAPIVAVTEWGTLSSAVDFRNGKAGPVSDMMIRLHDNSPTGDMLDWIRDVGIEFKRATIYIGFENTGSTLVPLLAGIINSPVEYAQELRDLRLELTDLTDLYDVALATRLTKEDCQYIAPDDDGKIAPICYGAPRKVKTVRAKAATRTTLSRYVAEGDGTFYVDDAEDFPQGTPIKIRIGYELIEGSFSGNTFTVTTRGADVYSGVTTQVTGNPNKLRDVALCGFPSDWFVNYFVKVDFADGQGIQKRAIVGFDGFNGVIMYVPAFRWPDYTIRFVLANQAYSIGSVASAHNAGDEIALVLDEYKWVVCDAPADSIEKVYVRVLQIDSSDVNAATNVGDYGYEHWAELDKRWYRYNLADTTIIPGKTVTTIAMLWEPLSAPGAYSGPQIGLPLGPLPLGPCPYASNEMLVDVVMPSDNHPADIIADVLENRLGVSPSEIDTTSFAAVKAATSTFEFNFALYEEIEGREMLAQLAFQSCNALLWDEGKVYLKRLSLSAANPVKSIPKARIYEDTPALTHTDLRNITTEVTATVTEDGNTVQITYENAAAVAAYGRRTDNLNLWCVDSRRMARLISMFWLYFWALPYELIEFSAPLTELELQNLDAITLADVAILPANQRVRIIRIDHNPGHGDRKQIDRVTYQAQVPLSPGCSTGCEWLCEQTEETACALSGCEVGCEVSCQYACRSDCQHVCELLGCVSSCEMFCTAPCEFQCQLACQIACEQGPEGGGCSTACTESPCQTECELQGEEEGCDEEVEGSNCTGQGCTWGPCNEGCITDVYAEVCNTNIEACKIDAMVCGSYCQIVCQLGGCQSACESVCMTPCTNACETPCTLACEVDCQDTCETNCQGGCTGGNEAPCEEYCQSNPTVPP